MRAFVAAVAVAEAPRDSAATPLIVPGASSRRARGREALIPAGSGRSLVPKYVVHCVSKILRARKNSGVAARSVRHERAQVVVAVESSAHGDPMLVLV